MFFYAIRVLCVTFWVSAALKGYPAASKGDWPVFVDAVAMALLALVMWFAVSPGAERFRAPRIGPRALRLVVYATILALSVALMFPWMLGVAASACPGTLTPLLSVAVLAPFLQAELQPRHDGDARA